MSRLAGASHAPPASDEARSRTGLRLLAASALLLAACVVQDAGRMVADTKLDLVVDPATSLARALTLWDPTGAFGQVGNQTYGYLWPMGPFFLLGEALGVPGWLVQRLWQALVLVVAFQGAARLARALGTRGDTALLVTGFAYALSPRLLTTVGPISIEAWPSAVAPWVLLALVHGSRQGSARRAAIAAGLAVGMVGGVNAAATFAVIPLGVVWLLTREAGPRRRTLMLWWPLTTLLACLWWLVPLFLLGAYSPPFLDYIESSGVTTYPTTLFNVLRGTSAWIPYVEPRWRAGNDLISDAAPILNSTLVIALGVAGVVRRDNPHRTFLVSGLLVGVLMVTAGHAGAAQGWGAAEVRGLLDGVLAPLRNVHKFDPVVRLPLVLGLGHLVAVVMEDWHRRRAEPPSRPSRWESLSRLGPAWLAVVAVTGAALPLAVGRLMPAESFDGIPDYWQETAAWLADQQPGSDGPGQESDVGADAGGRALLVPGSSFGDYTWGNTQDEPLQPLALSPWAVRNAIPLTPGGTIRALDAVEERLQRGEGSAALTAYLRRMGVRWLVLRNDLDRSTDVIDPTLVHQAVATSPGISFRTAFGPLVGGEARLDFGDQEAVVAHGWQDQYAAVEVFEVAPEAAVSTAEGLPVVVGGPEDLLTLSEQGVLDDQPVRLGVDTDPTTDPEAPVVLTDGLRRRDRVFGRLHDAVTPTLTDAETASLSPVRDYRLTDDDGAWRTRARVEGVAGVRASSSLALSRGVANRRVTAGPYAAFDGDPDSAWISDPGRGGTPWLRIELKRPTDVGELELTVGPEPSTTSELEVRTQQGSTEPTFVEPGDRLTLDLPAGTTSWVEVRESSGQPGRELSLAEVHLAGVPVRRWLVTPPVPAAWGAPDVVSLDNGIDGSSGCVTIDGGLRCTPGRQSIGEDSGIMRRIVALPQPAIYDLAVRAVPRPGSVVQELLTRDSLVDVAASSSATTSVSAAGPLATIDDDPTTTWVSSPIDGSPSLDLTLVEPRRISRITLALDPEAPARRPTAVRVDYPGGSQLVSLDADGEGRLDPVRVDRVTLTVDRSTEVRSIGFDGSVTNLGVGVSEIELNGRPVGPVGVGTEPVDYGCGSGPELRLNVHRVVRTAVVAAPVDVHRGRPVLARPCATGPLRLEAGRNRVRLRASEAFSPQTLVLTRLGSPDTLVDPPAPVTPAADGTLPVGPDARFLVLRHNANPGWEASAGDEALSPLVVDGWQQGFALGAEAEPVRVDYAPETAYRQGLVAGAVALALALLLLVVTLRRPGRTDHPPLGPSRWAPAVATAGWLAVGGVLAGTVGAVVLLATAGLLWAARSRWDVASAVALLPLLLVGGWYAVRPWGGTLSWAGSSPVAQWLMLVPLAVVATAAVLDRPSVRKRDSGRSTSQ